MNVRRRKNVRPPWYVHKRAYVYVISVTHQDLGTYEPFGYIGQTVRDPYVRLAEHVEDKEWAGWIVGVNVLWTGTCTQAQLDEIERRAIVTYKPLYNIEHNMTNPRRIKPWEVKRRRVRTGVRPTRLAPGVGLAGMCAFLMAFVMFALLISMFS